MAAEHDAVKVAQKQRPSAQKRVAMKEGRHAEKRAHLALLRADPADAADAFVQWKDSLYALQEAGGLATAHRPGSVDPVDLRWEVAGEQGTKYFHTVTVKPVRFGP